MVVIAQVLARNPKPIGLESNKDPDGFCDFATRAFFESLFLFADKDDKGELVVEDLETLFQARSLSLCWLACLNFRVTLLVLLFVPERLPQAHSDERVLL